MWHAELWLTTFDCSNVEVCCCHFGFEADNDFLVLSFHLVFKYLLIRLVILLFHFICLSAKNHRDWVKESRRQGGQQQRRRKNWDDTVKNLIDQKRNTEWKLGETKKKKQREPQGKREEEYAEEGERGESRKRKKDNEEEIGDGEIERKGRKRRGTGSDEQGKNARKEDRSKKQKMKRIWEERGAKDEENPTKQEFAWERNDQGVQQNFYSEDNQDWQGQERGTERKSKKSHQDDWRAIIETENVCEDARERPCGRKQ